MSQHGARQGFSQDHQPRIYAAQSASRSYCRSRKSSTYNRNPPGWRRPSPTDGEIRYRRGKENQYHGSLTIGRHACRRSSWPATGPPADDAPAETPLLKARLLIYGTCRLLDESHDESIGPTIISTSADQKSTAMRPIVIINATARTRANERRVSNTP